jgi:hypothetical protein
MSKNKELLVNTLIGEKVRQALMLKAKEYLNDNVDFFIDEFVSSIKQGSMREEVLIDLLSILDISDVMLATIRKELEEENIELL